MKLLVADFFHDSDKGGGGMVSGTIKMLYDLLKRHDCQGEVSLLCRFSDFFEFLVTFY